MPHGECIWTTPSYNLPINALTARCIFQFRVDEKVDVYRGAPITWQPGRSAITGLGRGPEV